jgi:hypothetical protein
VIECQYVRPKSLARKMTDAAECLRVLKRTAAQNNLSSPQTQRYNFGWFEPSIRENDGARIDLRKGTDGGFSRSLKVDPNCEPSFSQRILSWSVCHSD